MLRIVVGLCVIAVVAAQTQECNAAYNAYNSQLCLRYLQPQNINLSAPASACGNIYQSTCLQSILTSLENVESRCPPKDAGNLPVNSLTQYLPSLRVLTKGCNCKPLVYYLNNNPRISGKLSDLMKVDSALLSNVCTGDMCWVDFVNFAFYALDPENEMRLVEEETLKTDFQDLCVKSSGNKTCLEELKNFFPDWDVVERQASNMSFWAANSDKICASECFLKFFGPNIGNNGLADLCQTGPNNKRCLAFVADAAGSNLSACTVNDDFAPTCSDSCKTAWGGVINKMGCCVGSYVDNFVPKSDYGKLVSFHRQCGFSETQLQKCKPDKILSARVRLALRFDVYEQNKQEFDDAFVLDVARAYRVAVRAVTITKVSRGSVVYEYNVTLPADATVQVVDPTQIAFTAVTSRANVVKALEGGHPNRLGIVVRDSSGSSLVLSGLAVLLAFLSLVF